MCRKLRSYEKMPFRELGRQENLLAGSNEQRASMIKLFGFDQPCSLDAVPIFRGGGKSEILLEGGQGIETEFDDRGWI